LALCLGWHELQNVIMILLFRYLLVIIVAVLLMNPVLSDYVPLRLYLEYYSCSRFMHDVERVASAMLDADFALGSAFALAWTRKKVKRECGQERVNVYMK